MRITSSAARCVGAIAMTIALAASSLGAKAEPAGARPCGGTDYNAMILDIIKGLPNGGGYSRGSSFQLPTITAHNIGGGRWEMRVYDGFPSHCTSATYAVFARLVSVLLDNGRIALDGEQIATLSAKNRMPDGAHAGRRPGPVPDLQCQRRRRRRTAQAHRHRHELPRRQAALRAAPAISSSCSGTRTSAPPSRAIRSIYLGHKTVGSRDMVCFWGSQRQNKKKRSGGTEALYFPAAEGDKVVDGYGEACRPRADIKAMIFSRVTCMEHLAAGLDDMRRQGDRQPRRAVPVRRRVSCTSCARRRPTRRRSTASTTSSLRPTSWPTSRPRRRSSAPRRVNSLVRPPPPPLYRDR